MRRIFHLVFSLGCPLVGVGSHTQEFGDTALHCAYRSKATECIETLLAAGADAEVSKERFLEATLWSISETIFIAK